MIEIESKNAEASEFMDHHGDPLISFSCGTAGPKSHNFHPSSGPKTHGHCEPKLIAGEITITCFLFWTFDAFAMQATGNSDHWVTLLKVNLNSKKVRTFQNSEHSRERWTSSGCFLKWQHSKWLIPQSRNSAFTQSRSPNEFWVNLFGVKRGRAMSVCLKINQHL